MDGLEHEVEHLGVQQRQGYQSAARQPLEAGYTHVQQVRKTFSLLIFCAKNLK